MTRRAFSLVAVALSLLASVRPATAWNGVGHQVSALIAWQDLTPTARLNVIRLLHAHPDFADMLTHEATPADDKDREAFLTAATWPDLVRTPGRPSSRYNRPVWHYIDLPYVLGDWPAATTQPETPEFKWTPGADPINAAQAWQKCSLDLTDSKLTDAERGIALCWIEHLTGDIHQPLHAVSLFNAQLPNGDQGGNALIIRHGETIGNLHSLWDGLIGSDQTFDVVAQTAKRIAETHRRSEFTEQLKVTSFDRWAQASADQARVVVYWEGKLPYLTRQQQNQDRSQPVPELPPGYMVLAQATAETDIALAGYRLADTLNDLLGK